MIDTPRPRLAWHDHRTFFLPPESWHDPWLLDAAETHHLSHVLRLREGEEIRLLDGQGREGRFLVRKIGRSQTALDFIEAWEHPRPESGVILAAAWTKAARRGWFLEKSVEFEASGIWMWQADRSQFAMPADLARSWRGSLIAGAKQCRNPWLPELRALPGGVAALIDALNILEQSRPVHRLVLLEEGLLEQGASQPLDAARLAAPGLSVCIVGPEGGFSPAEAQALLQSGCAPITLGSRVLRWETAAMLTLGLFWWQRQLA